MFISLYGLLVFSIVLAHLLSPKWATYVLNNKQKQLERLNQKQKWISTRRKILWIDLVSSVVILGFFAYCMVYFESIYYPNVLFGLVLGSELGLLAFRLGFTRQLESIDNYLITKSRLLPSEYLTDYIKLGVITMVIAYQIIHLY